MKRLTLFNRNVRLQCSSLLERLDLLDEIDEIDSTTEASNSKPSVREHWLIVLKNFLFSYGCDSWINRLLFLEMWAWAISTTPVKDILHDKAI